VMVVPADKPIAGVAITRASAMVMRYRGSDRAASLGIDVPVRAELEL